MVLAVVEAPTLQEARERATIRDLARRVAEIAHSAEQAAIRRRWRDVNALRRPDRAPVWCRPVDAWRELLPDDDLTCHLPLYRSAERRLRQDLIKHQIGDDTPIEPFWSVPAAFAVDPPNTWGVTIRRIAPDTPGGAYRYDPPLKTEADFDRLAFPTYTFLPEKTQAALDQAHDLLGDLLPVRRTCHVPQEGTLCHTAAELRGQGELMWDLADRPDLVHRLMKHLSDSIIRAQQAHQRTGLLTLNNEGPMYCSDPPERDPQPGDVRLSDLWITANSQDFDQVSPAMWEEFLLAYQLPMLSQFRYASYGCCENLTRKIGGVLKIPNLRVFVCSAWTDLEQVVDAVGDRYTIMWRQKASDVVFAPDLPGIRRHLEEGLRIARGCYVQIVLRELQTLNGRPNRLAEWAAVAKEVAGAAS